MLESPLLPYRVSYYPYFSRFVASFQRQIAQRLKPGVENQSEWLASYAEVFAPTDIDFDHVLG